MRRNFFDCFVGVVSVSVRVIKSESLFVYEFNYKYRRCVIDIIEFDGRILIVEYEVIV